MRLHLGPALTIWIHLFTYGLSISIIINEPLNRKALINLYISASKYLPAFAIDLPLDDSPGLGTNGVQFGFQTILVGIDDLNWKSNDLRGINSN